MIDTPGFDDSSLSERDVLMKILCWLNTTYQQQQKLNGILYLHRIDAPRMQGSALRNFNMFKQLCGEDFYGNIILGTTCWSPLHDKSVLELREADLKDKGGFWYPMITGGSRYVRIPEDHKSALRIIFPLAVKNSAFLKSQDEMGNKGLSINKLSAIKTLNTDLEELKAENERKLKQQKEMLAARQREEEATLKAAHERRKSEAEACLRKQEKEKERVLKREREQEARRQGKIRALEEQMRRMKLEEEQRRERKRMEHQKRLDDKQFGLDFQLLVQARAYKQISSRVLCCIGMYPVCGHCFRVLEYASYYGEIHPSFDSHFRMLQVLLVAELLR
jgi:hypothetical protein